MKKIFIFMLLIIILIGCSKTAETTKESVNTTPVLNAFSQEEQTSIKEYFKNAKNIVITADKLEGLFSKEIYNNDGTKEIIEVRETFTKYNGIVQYNGWDVTHNKSYAVQYSTSLKMLTLPISESNRLTDDELNKVRNFYKDIVTVKYTFNDFSISYNNIIYNFNIIFTERDSSDKIKFVTLEKINNEYIFIINDEKIVKNTSLDELLKDANIIPIDKADIVKFVDGDFSIEEQKYFLESAEYDYDITLTSNLLKKTKLIKITDKSGKEVFEEIRDTLTKKNGIIRNEQFNITKVTKVQDEYSTAIEMLLFGIKKDNEISEAEKVSIDNFYKSKTNNDYEYYFSSSSCNEIQHKIDVVFENKVDKTKYFIKLEKVNNQYIIIVNGNKVIKNTSLNELLNNTEINPLPKE